MLRFMVCVVGALALGACAGPSLPTTGVYKVGKPYQVKGVWYYPQEDFNYDETGLASWYGPGFHGKTTANGEIYDENELTAAHKTLQMPALVRVSNLENGRSVVVRLNDRGPYYPGRIIDMSRRGAQLLGFEGKGTAKVRVQVLTDESRQLAAAAKAGTPLPVLTAAGEAPPPVTAAPRAKIEVSGGPTPVPAPPAPPPPTMAVATAPATVPGAVVGGRFLPAPQVQQTQVRPDREGLYIQAGAFTIAENARRLSQKLSSYGNAHVSEATVDGRRFYRVRLGPMPSVAAADALLERILSSGQEGAKIIVD